MLKLPLDRFALVIEQMGANAICSGLVPKTLLCSKQRQIIHWFSAYKLLTRKKKCTNFIPYSAIQFISSTKHYKQIKYNLHMFEFNKLELQLAFGSKTEVIHPPFLGFRIKVKKKITE